MDSISLIKGINNYCSTKIRLFFSRRRAFNLINQVVEDKGFKTINNRKKKLLRSYDRENFGSSSFWPWLALYTEIRGEFKPRWIPDDYYTVYWLPKYNPESIRISDYKSFDYR